MSSAARQRGFTLVEVLVVLIIAGFVTTLLFQALSQVYRLQDRFATQLQEGQDGAMRADWFRLAIQGLQTDYLHGPNVFTGAGRQLKGFSLSALSADLGAPQAFSLTLDYLPGVDRTDVVYELPKGARSVLFSWRGRRGSLSYLDGQRKEHEQWPPLAQGSWPQLPSAVLLKVPQEEGSLTLVAVPRGSPEARVRPLQFGATPP